MCRRAKPQASRSNQARFVRQRQIERTDMVKKSGTFLYCCCSPEGCETNIKTLIHIRHSTCDTAEKTNWCEMKTNKKNWTILRWLSVILSNLIFFYNNTRMKNRQQQKTFLFFWWHFDDKCAYPLATCAHFQYTNLTPSIFLSSRWSDEALKKNSNDDDDNSNNYNNNIQFVLISTFVLGSLKYFMAYLINLRVAENYARWWCTCSIILFTQRVLRNTVYYKL